MPWRGAFRRARAPYERARARQRDTQNPRGLLVTTLVTTPPPRLHQVESSQRDDKTSISIEDFLAPKLLYMRMFVKIRESGNIGTPPDLADLSFQRRR